MKESASIAGKGLKGCGNNGASVADEDFFGGKRVLLTLRKLQIEKLINMTCPQTIMSIEEEIDKVEVIENLDDEGIFQIAKHRGEYFQISVDPESRETFYVLFPDNYVSSEKLQKVILCEVVVFLGGKVPLVFRKPVLAHEIAESIYGRKGYAIVDAHNHGIECELIYAKKFMDKDTRQEFLEWIEKNAGR